MRAITFPKTGRYEWTNRETGVRIVRSFTAGYTVVSPNGEQVSGYGYLDAAKAAALDTAKAYRNDIAAAYEAACREDAERVAKAERRERADAMSIAHICLPRGGNLSNFSAYSPVAPTEIGA